MEKLVDSEGRPMDQEKDRIPSRAKVRKSHTPEFNKWYDDFVARLEQEAKEREGERSD